MRLVHVSLLALLVATPAAAAATTAARPSAGERALSRQVDGLVRRNADALALARRVAPLVALAGPTGPAGPGGAPGEPGPQGDPGAPGADGPPGALALTKDLPSGRTVSGAWGNTQANPGQGVFIEHLIGLPTKAPRELTDGDVLVAPADRCPGTFEHPVAAPGTVCIYLAPQQSEVASVTGRALPGAPARGFVIRVTASTPHPTPVLSRLRAAGTWAYTAP